MNPKLSVVIPVKNNSGTLKSTLKTLLQQDYKPLEIVVSNNSQQDEIKDLIKKIDDKRIKYLCPKRKLNFSDDWNFALSGVTGEFVTFLGDDDGFMPGAISYAMNIFNEKNIDAITWRKLNYNWPNHLIEYERNILEGQSSQEIQLIDAKKALKLSSKFLLGYNQLPCIYNSIVKIKIINKAKSLSTQNKFFNGVIPDVYSSIVIANLIGKYLYMSFPLTLNGGSEKSSGIISGLAQHTDSQKEKISDIVNSGQKYHKDIGPFSSSIASIFLGEFLLAKNNMPELNWPEPSWRLYVLYLRYESKGARNSGKILDAATYTAKARNMIFFPKKNRKSVFTENSPSYFSGRIRFPENIIDDVDCASQIFNDLIPFDKAPTYSSPSSVVKEWILYTISSLLRIYRLYKLK